MMHAWIALVLAAAAALPLQAQTAASAPAVERSSAPDTSARLQGAALLKALRGGGYVVYFRHTATDFSRNDAAMKGFDDCDNQRLLSPQGRDDARRIGEAIRALKLAGGEVLASPMCRTMEHARLSFGSATPTGEVSLRERGDSGDYPGLVKLLATPVGLGSNRWMVGHGIPFRAVAGAPHLGEGEAAVIKPDGRGWTVVARIAVADWPMLARR
ncbi:MAG: histidine phosphatase family protein [Burkholderiaceae bacterium]|nr:histidine phosphatase family protein [Burkholderiaceae bacterium]